MKIQLVTFLTFFLTSSYAAEVYKSIDEQGDVVYSDHPLASSQQQQKIELTDAKKNEKSQANQQLKQRVDEDKAIRRRLDEKRHQLEAMQRKLEQANVKLQVIEKAMHAAQNEWLRAVEILAHDNTGYNRKRALQLEKNHERVKAQYTRAEQELAKVQSERNSLR